MIQPDRSGHHPIGREANHMVTHRRYLDSDDIVSSNSYLSAPISTQRYKTSGLISIEYLVYFWICSTFFIIPLFHLITHSPFTPVSYFHLGCVPHLFIQFLTHPLTSAYSFLSRPHMPLFFTDSFVHTTHFDSDLLTNRSHVPYPLFSSYLFLYGQTFPNMGEQ